MKNLEISVQNIDQLASVAQSILQFGRNAGNKKVFALYGPMGSGKTTIIKEICRQLGSHDNFSSPTYSIVNEYLVNGNGDKIYHIDLYRLKNLEEALDLGIEEHISGDSYCFIEWPGLIKPLLPVATINVEIKPNDNMRQISIFME